MALKLINLSKDNTKLLNTVVKDVYIQTRENLYSGNPLYNNWKNAGYIPEAGVKVTAEPRTKKLVDGNTLAKGYDIGIEIICDQYYSLYQFEKFNNELCFINLHGIVTFIKDIIITVGLDATFNQDGDAMVKLTGTVFVQKIRDCIDGSPWGDLTPPWATDVSVPEGGVPAHRGIPQSEDDPLNYYEYVFTDDPQLIEYINPSVPQNAVSAKFGTGSAGTSIVLSEKASGVDDFYNGRTIRWNGIERTITDYTGSTKTATISSAFATDPLVTDQYTILPSNIEEFKISLIDQTRDLVPSEPKDLVAELFIGSTVVVINPADYDILYEGGVYKFHYTSASTTFILGDKIAVKFNL